MARLHIFGHSVEEGQAWINGVMSRVSIPDEAHAYRILKAVLHALRDRIGPANAVHLAAQLPLLIRGAFFEGWRLVDTPTRERHLPDFLRHVGKDLGEDHLPTIEAYVRAVFSIIWERVDQGEVAKLMERFPQELRELWQEPTAA